MGVSRIKGITVEISGETTGLDKALKSVNTTIKSTQTQLKDVERLLKLDPSNTELLSQKQRLLKEAIGATKEKLESLKTAQEQAKKQLENGDLGQDKYDALQREIEETEQALKQLESQVSTTYAKLETLDTVGKKLETAGNSISGVGRKLLPVTGAITAVGVAAVKTTADFDSSMSQVSAISGATGKDFDDLRSKAREMGSKTKFSASEAADAMTYMAMAGWKTEDMLDGIEGVMNLAAASGEDLASTSDIVTDALTAFGLSAKDSGHFADILAATSSNANTNVAMMGETFKYAAPVAGALGYKAEDVAIAIGLMGNSGIKASQAGTALRTLFTNMAKPTDTVAAAMDKLGISLDDGQGNMKSFKEVMDDLRSGFGELKMPADEVQAAIEKLDAQYESGELTEKQYAEASEELMKQAYGAEGALKAEAAASLAGKMGLSGLLAIVNASDEDYEKLTEAIYNCDGVTEQMAETMQDNLAGQLTILKSQLQELAISFGDVLMPIIRKVVSHIQDFVDKLNGMSDAQRETIIKVLAFVAALGPLLIIIGKTVSTVGVAMQGISKFGKGIVGLSSSVKNGTGVIGKMVSGLAAMPPIVWIIVAVIAVLTAAFVHLWKTNAEFKEKIIGYWEKLKAKFQEVGQKIVEAFNSLGFEFEDIAEVFDWLCNEVFAPLLDFLLGSVMDCIGDIIEVFGGVVEVIIGIIKGFKDGDWSTLWQGLSDIATGIINLLWEPIQWLFHLFGVELDDFDGDWSALWTKVKGFFVNIWTAIKDFFVGIWNGIKNTVTTVIGAIKTFIETVWNGIKDFFTTVLTSIKTAFSTAWNAIKTTVTTVVNAIKSVITTVWTAIQTAVTTVVNAIKTVITTVWNAIQTSVTTSVNATKTTVTTVWEAIKTAVSTVVNAIKTAVTTAWEGIKTAVTTVVNGIKTTVTTVWTAIQTAVTTVVNAIKTTITTVWNAIKTTITTVINGIKTTLTTVWNAIQTTVTTVVNSIKTTITTVWNAIKTTITTVINSIKTTLTTVWNAIQTTITTVVNAIKTTITTVWNAIKTTVTTVVNAIKTTITTVWNAIKTTVTTVENGIKTAVTTSWNAVKTTVTSVVNGIKTTVTSVWNSIKTSVTTTMSGLKSGIDSAWNGIKSGISSAVNTVKTTVSTAFNSIKTTASTTWENIKSAMTRPIENAKSAISGAIERIKGLFNFSWSFPRPKMPHFSWYWQDVGGILSIPRFSIDWYKKAMDNPMILSSPTIFGMSGNHLLGGGEAGSEMIVGVQTLMDSIRQAVAGLVMGTTNINYGGVTVNVYSQPGQDISELADVIEERINNNVLKRKAAFA